MTPEEIQKEMKRHFFAAMRVGWAAGVEGVGVLGMPSHKAFVYEEDHFRVIDQYCVSKAGKSAGTITVWFFDEPVWLMNYGGVYRKEDVSFLKHVLMVAYRQDQFFGGRGQEIFRQDRLDGLVYVNRMAGGSDFLSFRGTERIYSASDPELLGWHDYWGMSLID